MAICQSANDHEGYMLHIWDRSIRNVVPNSNRDLVCYDYERVRQVLCDKFLLPSSLESQATSTRQVMDKMLGEQETDGVFDDFAALADRIHNQGQQRLGQPLDGKSKPSTARLEHLQDEQRGMPHRIPAKLSFCGWPTLQVGDKKWFLSAVIVDADGRPYGYIPFNMHPCHECESTFFQHHPAFDHMRVEHKINLERPGAYMCPLTQDRPDKES
ncbi:hypothetical protein PFICI_10453 [Pestalotiopsis fici W106-1]|uniref:C2H2-type domain-containing protein n=1 Tax=Pestalotiopsis fici (strain W106-1 / CGMCC3.15140) TaxID=1229662 RepID=W3WZS6_PESFW|nr:uncharacterized protein PFICI_10453 [Pestalotiopsis fici W106-1]ETS78391.1 hypothetical protein PFICI_10453 [Pestalotiopsis fici W106-1]